MRAEESISSKYLGVFGGVGAALVTLLFVWLSQALPNRNWTGVMSNAEVAAYAETGALPPEDFDELTPPRRCQYFDLDAKGVNGTKKGVRLCFSTKTCVGRFEVSRSRRDCPPSPRNVAREDSEKALPDIRAAGPDAFHVRLEGQNEVVAVDLEHNPMEPCHYAGSFVLTTTGQFQVQAFSMFERDWHGVADQMYQGTQPKYSPHPLVPTGTTLTCAAPQFPYTLANRLPTCKSLSARGRWVQESWNNDEKRKADDRLKSKITGWPTKWTKQGVVFTTSWGSHLTWQPYTCKYTPYSQDDLVSMLGGRRIAFIGDSQTRSMFYPTVNSLNENKILGNPKIQDQNPKAGKSDFSVRGDIFMRYYYDNFLADQKDANSPNWHDLMRLEPNSGEEWDVIIAGFGNWAAACSIRKQGLGMWSLQDYQERIDEIVQQMRAFSTRTGMRVIWHLQPAFPWDVDACRNNPRLKLFNEYARSVIGGAGFEIWDTYSSSIGMLHTAIGFPLGHFNDFHVRENWARVLLSYLADHPDR